MELKLGSAQCPRQRIFKTLCTPMLPPNHYLAPRITALPADGSMQQEEDCSPAQRHLHHCDNFCRASKNRIPSTGQRTRKTRLGIPASLLTSSVYLGLATPWATVFSSAITSRTIQHPLTGLLVSPVNFTVLCQCWLLASMFPSVQRECIQLFSNSFSPGIFDVSNSKAEKCCVEHTLEPSDLGS